MKEKAAPLFRISDYFAILFVLGLAFFFLSPWSSAWFQRAYGRFPIVLSFVKFALLPTFGEMLILRYKTGRYATREFGLVPRAVVWGTLGVMIYFALAIFSGGVDALVIRDPASATTAVLVLAAFLASFFMNVIFSPVLMVAHNLADRFIAENRGRFPVRDFRPAVLLGSLNWDVMWNFLLKKTIPLFWIPAHTVTFLLPAEYRILFSAFLSIILGLILSFAGGKLEMIGDPDPGEVPRNGDDSGRMPAW